MTDDNEDFLGSTEMSARIRALDWAHTTIGPISGWPQSLRAALSICLGSRFPIALYWGPRFALIYNDAWSPILGAKHPWALGRDGSEVWPELWESIGPLYEGVRGTGESMSSEDQLLPMHRHGYTEECYFNYTLAPVRGESRRIEGVFNAVIETTYRVIGERRTRLLRDLSERLATVRSERQVYEVAAEVLEAAPLDAPFVALYQLDGPATEAHLVRALRLPPGCLAAAPAVTLGSADDTALWSLATSSTGEPLRLLSLPPDAFGGHPPGTPWPEPATQAFVLRLSVASSPFPDGFLVLGVSPRRAVDDDYRHFAQQLAGALGGALTAASAYEAERQRAEKLAELDHAKSLFFSNISHEFRTPLTLMLGPLDEMIAQARHQTAPDLDSLTRVHRNGQRLLKLVNALLDFSRIEAGHTRPHHEPTDLAAFTTELASAFRSAIERVGLQLDVRCPPLSQPFAIDRDMWEKIVFNLLSNALKHTFAGTISVHLDETPSHVSLTVSDTGSGIPADELPRLFERFHRVAGARSRTHEGTGIGLALVRELVKLHDGEVTVTSTLGEGTSFCLRLPRLRSTLQAPTPPPLVSPQASLYLDESTHWSASPPLSSVPSSAVPSAPPAFTQAFADQRKRILLVDDNADMRDYVRRLLEPYGDVEAFADGQTALDATRQRPPDLVLSDVMMPGLDGFALLSALMDDEHTRQIPVILLSARAGEEATVEGLRRGASDYLIKPFSARELIARVVAHLALGHARRTLEEVARREQLARQQAEENGRIKDEFLSTLSHELRTPLNAILGWAHLLRNGAVHPNDQRRALETIEQNARAQSRLVEDMLDMSRIVQGKMTLSVVPVDLVRVLRAAVETTRPAAEARQIRVQLDLASHAPVVGDPDRIQQIIWNLLANAIKFTPPHGLVHVSLRRTGTHAEIAIQDSGVGISPEFLPHVFERFRQADGATTRRQGGLGLGLAIVRNLVELHGGTVHASSEGLQRGSTFRVLLPQTPALPRDPSAASPGDLSVLDCPPGMALLRVLIVDDDADARNLLTFVLRRCGSQATAVASAEEALALLLHDPFDVLVADIEMPDRDGLHLVRELRQQPDARLRKLPALALSGHARPEDRTAALRAGFHMHLTKPIEPGELLVTIATLTGAYARPSDA